jgi:hypothetical protein
LLRFIVAILGIHVGLSSFDIDDGYRKYLLSDMYIDSIKDKLIAENCYTILFRKFQGVLESDVFDDALNNVGCDRSFLEDENIPLINPEFSPSVPVDDFLLSRELFIVLKTTHDRAYTIGVDWPHAHQTTNVWAYHLMTGVNQRSTCVTTDCRVLKKLIEQFHFRLSMLLRSSEKPPNKFEFLLPLDIVFSVRQNMEHQIQSSLPRPPELVRTRAELVRTGCWGWLCRQPTSRIPTPVTPVIDHLGTLLGKQTDHGRKAFVEYADNILDIVIVELGSVSNTSFPIMIEKIRKEVIPPLMIIARGVLFDVSGAEIDRIFNILFHFIAVVARATEERNPWPQILVLTRECVSQLRVVNGRFSIV